MKNFLKVNRARRAKKNFKLFKLLVLIMVLIASINTAWADLFYYSVGTFNVNIKKNGNDNWIYGANGADERTSNNKSASLKEYDPHNEGVVNTYVFDACWINGYASDSWNIEKIYLYYKIDGGSQQDWGVTNHSWSSNNFAFSATGMNIDLVSTRSPGNHTFEFWWKLDNNSSSNQYCNNNSKNYKINYTIPGFTTTATSHTFANTVNGSTVDETISFTQHYGTALTTSNCSLSNSTDFQVISITETDVTVRFKPQSNGTKSSTLTITDAHSKTCTVTLSGTTKYLVTYSKGDNGSGDNHTDYKVHGTNLTLASSSSWFTYTGYHQTGWNTNSAGSGGTSYSLGGSYSANAAVTLYPEWTANTWYVRLNGNGSDGGSMSNESFTYDASATALTSNAFTRTGYQFNGWNRQSDGKGTSYTDGQSVRNLTSTKDGIVDIYAQWTANTYSVVFNGNGNTGGSMSNEGFTYDAAKALTSNAFYKDGYHFDYWTTNSDGSGTQYTDGQSVSNLTTTNSGTVNLYAHWTKVTVTDLTFAPAAAAGSTTVTVTPTLSATPTGTSSICWGFYYDAECEDEVEGVTFSSDPSSGANAVTFTTPNVSGTYYVQAIYRAGSTCAGTILNTYVEPYVVASEHTVTLKYVCSGTEIAARGSVTIPAASFTLVAPKTDIFGYSFSSWSAGDGVTISDPTDDELEEAEMTGKENVKKVSANYDGILTINYTKDNMIFFKDNLGWTSANDANAHIYVNLMSGSYWDSKRGSGNKNTYYSRNNEMNRVPGTTDIFYYNYGAGSISKYISFTKNSYPDYESFSESSPNRAEVVYVTNPYTTSKESGTQDYGFDAATPMFVPLDKTTFSGQLWNNDGGWDHAIYFNRGYWVNYIGEETGYTLEIYKSDGTTLLQTKKFTSANKLMSMSATVDLEAGTTYKFLLKRGSISCGNSGTMKVDNSGTAVGWRFAPSSTKCTIITSAAGDYIFNLSFSESNDEPHDLRIGVTYPSKAEDYRIVYKDLAQWSKRAHDANWYHPSRVISKRANGEDIVSFYVSKAVGASASMTLQQISSINAESGTISWTTGTNISSVLDGISESGVYNFKVTQDADGAATVTLLGKYEGEYYIRTANAGTTGWSDFQSTDHKMTYSDYAEDNSGYSHYYMKWCPRKTNVKFVIANDYSQCISDTLDQDYDASTGNFNPYSNLTSGGELYYQPGAGDPTYSDADAYLDKYSANIRFMWNQSTNKISRSYLSGATDWAKKALVLQGEDKKLLDSDGEDLTANPPGNYATMLLDKQNWIYEADVKVVPGGKIQVYGMYNDIAQYFIGTAGATATNGVELIGTNEDDATAYPIRVIYDFKINRIVAAWIPSALAEDLTINADVMIIRDHQGAAQNVELNAHTLTTEKTVYGVMQFNKYKLNNRSTTGGHDILPANEQLPQRQRNHYYISFPFDVNVSDIFGFGTYGVHWVLQYYDGKARAKNGLWADPGMTYWKYMPPTGKMNANEGYLLALSPSQMAYDKDGDGEVWANSKEDVELYFPATTPSASITTADISVDGLGSDYECTINRGTAEGDRTIKDSYWRCIGVPSFANFTAELYRSYTDEETNVPIAWSTTPVTITDDVHYLYTINWTDYTLRPMSGDTYNFQVMHAYMVQNKSAIIWKDASAFQHASSVAARRQKKEDIHDYEFRLTLNQNDELSDQTFVRLTDDENVSTGFEFGHDLSKEMYSTKAQIFTYIGYETVAANSMPFTEQTTVVPVGVKIASDGDYTFSMPDGTHGVGITLVDNETGVRTNISALDYTINLTAGDYTNRFFLEISPIHNAPTGIEEVTGDGLQVTGARKVLIDGILYIVKGDKLYDVRGTMIK